MSSKEILIKAPTGAVRKKNKIKHFVKSTGKHLCWNLFFKKVAGLRPMTSLKKGL